MNQNTGQNINQAAALAAGVRGAGSNAGLIASNAANTGATTQQNAIGQEATLAAEQQLNAQGQLENLAGTQVQQGTNAVQLQNQTQQNEQNILQGANTATNNANVSQQENINTTNAAVAAGNQNANQNVLSGIGNAINSVGSFIGGLFAEGGEVPSHLMEMAKIYHPKHFAPGGVVWQNSTPVQSSINAGAAPNLPQFVNAPIYNKPGASTPKTPAPAPTGTNPTGVGGTYGLGGQEEVDQLGSTNTFGAAPLTSDSFAAPELGSQFAGPAAALALARGGNVGGKLKAGGKVPGTPKVNHDAYKNDTVTAKLSPGEVVIDLNTLKDKGKLGSMARFVAANIERKKAGRKLA